MLEREQDASHVARIERLKAYATAKPVSEPPSEPPPAPAPAPASAPAARPVHPFADPEEAHIPQDVLEGIYAFEALMRTWVVNFEVEDAPQPDRYSAFLACFTGYSAQVNAYIRSRGGLGGACIDTLARTGIVAPEDAERIGKRIALNLVPIGTAMGIPLDGMLERSLWTRDADNAPVKGGPLKDTVDMTRPEYKQ
jgi:hypothetical protein